MARGKRLSGGQGDSFTIEFRVAGADSVSGVTTTTETQFSVSSTDTSGGTGNSTYWEAPWDCEIEEVYVVGQFLANGDIADFRVRRGTTTAFTTDDVISNGIGTSAVDYLRLTATAANQFNRQRYTGIPDVEGIATVAGFVEAESTIAAGNRLTATYKMAAAGDDASHMRCIVTVARLD